MDKTTAALLLLLAVCMSLGSPARAYDMSCDGGRTLSLCGLPGHRWTSVYQTGPGRDTYEYNAFQRLAGMIADHMDAGIWGDLRFKLKIILE